MRLLYAFVADAAQFTPDGRLWVLGGDISTITAGSFPAIHPAMTLVAKIEVQPTECGRNHRLRCVLLDPDGSRLQDELEVDFTPKPDPNYPHRPVGMGLAFNVLGAKFPRLGDYAFHLLVDDLEIGVVPLYLVTVPPQQQGLPEPGLPGAS